VSNLAGTDCGRTRPGFTPWAGLSLLLLFALTINAAAGVLHPAVGEFGHDAASQRLAVRLWTQSISRSVQRLARKQDERPALIDQSQRRIAVLRAALTPRVTAVTAPQPRSLRESLLALPPPVC